MPGTFFLYTDGASRGNPGRAAIGAIGYQVSTDGTEERFHISEYIGTKTSNQAEYQAVIQGLEQAIKEKPDLLILRSDSQLLVRQLQGRYRVKSPKILPLFQQVLELLGQLRDVKFEHIPREQNQIADSLANQALDR